jgi:hypothetical protein
VVLNEAPLTGDGWEAYQVVGDNAVSYSTSVSVADPTNTVTISSTAQGTISR